LKYLQAPGDGS